MSVTVRVPGPLRRFTGGQGALRAEAGSLRAILTVLSDTHDGLRARLFDAHAELQPVVRVFVGDTDIRALAGLDTPVAPGETVSLVLPVAGA